MDEAERTRGIAEYIVDKIHSAVWVYREIHRDDRRPDKLRELEYLIRRDYALYLDSIRDEAAFAEKYSGVLHMVPMEIIGILREGEAA